MVGGLSEQSLNVAKQLYSELNQSLQTRFPNHYIVIDPISKQYWVNLKLAYALRDALNAYPDRVFYSDQLGDGPAIRFN